MKITDREMMALIEIAHSQSQVNPIYFSLVLKRYLTDDEQLIFRDKLDNA